MADWQEAERYLVDRFRRERVIVGTPENIARESGFTPRQVEQALVDLIDQNKIHPFQDAEGRLEYEWKLP